jgi:hypothetical protein
LLNDTIINTSGCIITNSLVNIYLCSSIGYDDASQFFLPWSG